MAAILIAIDDQVISMLVGEELSEEGYSILTISDPCMLRLAIQGNRADLLVIDEFFGGGKGIDFCLKFRKYLLYTTVIVWTSCISALGGKKKRLPPNFHIFKTHTLQELTQEIRRWMRQPGVQRTQEKSLAGESRLGR